MSKRRKLIQELNAGSMADIAFLLLVYWLVTTTMDIDSGLARKLPPLPEDQQEPIDINDRDVFIVLVNANDQILCEGQYIQIDQLQPLAKEFIVNLENRDDLPQKRSKMEKWGSMVTTDMCTQFIKQENARLAKNPDNKAAEQSKKKWQKRLNAVNYFGPYDDCPKQVISLKNDRSTSYDMYVQVQNELASAYNELRNELAKRTWGITFSDMIINMASARRYKKQINAIKSVYPQRISEAEPEDVGATAGE